MTAGGGLEGFETEHAAVGVDRSSNVELGMGIDPSGHVHGSGVVL
jgi:hypothetical protein